MLEREIQKSKLDDLVKRNRVVLFMKGSASVPLCGMSSTIRFMLKKSKLKFVTIDLLINPSLHSYMKEKFSPISAPYLYVDGKFFGGYDKVVEVFNSGRLRNLLERF